MLSHMDAFRAEEADEVLDVPEDGVHGFDAPSPRSDATGGNAFNTQSSVSVHMRISGIMRRYVEWNKVFPSFIQFYGQLCNATRPLRDDATMRPAYNQWLLDVMTLYGDAWHYDGGKLPSLNKVAAVMYAAQLHDEECVDQEYLHVRRGRRCLVERASKTTETSTAGAVCKGNLVPLPKRLPPSQLHFISSKKVNSLDMRFPIRPYGAPLEGFAAAAAAAAAVPLDARFPSVPDLTLEQRYHILAGHAHTSPDEAMDQHASTSVDALQRRMHVLSGETQASAAAFSPLASGGSVTAEEVAAMFAETDARTLADYERRQLSVVYPEVPGQRRRGNKPGRATEPAFDITQAIKKLNALKKGGHLGTGNVWD
jgi:hypothetical protein